MDTCEAWPVITIAPLEENEDHTPGVAVTNGCATTVIADVPNSITSIIQDVPPVNVILPDDNVLNDIHSNLSSAVIFPSPIDSIVPSHHIVSNDGVTSDIVANDMSNSNSTLSDHNTSAATANDCVSIPTLIPLNEVHDISHQYSTDAPTIKQENADFPIFADVTNNDVICGNDFNITWDERHSITRSLHTPESSNENAFNDAKSNSSGSVEILSEHDSSDSNDPDFTPGRVIHKKKQTKAKSFYSGVPYSQPTPCCWKCDVCGDKFPAKFELTCHIENEHTYKSSHQIANHLESFDLTPLTINTCLSCNRAYDSENTLTYHMQYSHNIKFGPTTQPRCSLCTQNFKSLKQFQVHLYSHLIPELKIKPLYACSKCLKVLPGPTEWERHNKVHEKTMFHVCSVCKGNFNDKMALTEHKKKHSGRNRKHTWPICQFCDKHFDEQFALILHRVKHLTKLAKKELYVCPICDCLLDNVTTLKGLMMHLETHDVKWYTVCWPCRLICDSTDCLNEHMKTHSLKKFQCEVCSLMFKQLSSYMDHVRVHRERTAFRCHLDECGAHFPTRSLLVRHSEMHFYKPQAELRSCATCREEFDNVFDYKAHMFAHLRVRYFKCKWCKVMFFNKHDLETHANCIVNLKHQGIDNVDGGDNSTCKLPNVAKRVQEAKVYAPKKRLKADKLQGPIIIPGDGAVDAQIKQWMGVKADNNSRGSVNVGVRKLDTCRDFHCSMCERYFASIHAFRAHKLTCGGVTPETKLKFHCPKCPAQFGAAVELWGHSEQCHNRTSVYRFQCKTCAARFHKYDDIHRHMKTHWFKNKQLSTQKEYIDKFDGMECNNTFNRFKPFYKHIIEPHSLNDLVTVTDNAGPSMGPRNGIQRVVANPHEIGLHNRMSEKQSGTNAIDINSKGSTQSNGTMNVLLGASDISPRDLAEIESGTCGIKDETSCPPNCIPRAAFGSEHSLNLHLAKPHPGILLPEFRNKTNTPSNDSIASLSCPMDCEITFETEDDVRAHMLQVHSALHVPSANKSSDLNMQFNKSNAKLKKTNEGYDLITTGGCVGVYETTASEDEWKQNFKTQKSTSKTCNICHEKYMFVHRCPFDKQKSTIIERTETRNKQSKIKATKFKKKDIVDKNQYKTKWHKQWFYCPLGCQPGFDSEHMLAEHVCRYQYAALRLEPETSDGNAKVCALCGQSFKFLHVCPERDRD